MIISILLSHVPCLVSASHLDLCKLKYLTCLANHSGRSQPRGHIALVQDSRYTTIIMPQPCLSTGIRVAVRECVCVSGTESGKPLKTKH